MNIRKIQSILLLSTLFAFFSCNHRVESPYVVDPLNLQDGQTGYVNNADLSGKGLIVNRANTTIIFSGNIVLDDLSVIGNVLVAPNSTLTVKGLLNVAGGAKLKIEGNVITKDLTLVGEMFVNQSLLTVTGQLTAGGGTNTYLQNGYIRVNDFRILGNIYTLQNDFTTVTNGYSLVEMIGSKYLNRAGGSVMCGPLLFNSDDDKGASGVEMKSVLPSNDFKDAKNKNPYSQSDSVKFYQYGDVCTPKTLATSFQ